MNGGEVIFRKKVMSASFLFSLLLLLLLIIIIPLCSRLQISDFSLECRRCQLEEQSFLVSEQPLGVLGLSHWLTQTVDEDRSAAVGLQHRAHESLEEDEELLVLCGNAHLKRGERARKRLGELLGPRFLCGTGTQFFLVLLSIKHKLP
ncbi:hypothetical protein EYF80_043541 [Liparis tanakae]|uniref:Uncharacterized protein n=1 Tax=Liparis tanakae TaxID=230148 RepID=A0A4Z2FZ51_9TELE|nr:hypothetical protein EYF80_043541 [Liparis tanakae]